MLLVRYYLLFPLLFLYRFLRVGAGFFEVFNAKWFQALALLAAVCAPLGVAQAESKEQVSRGVLWLQAQVQPDGSLQSEATSIASSVQVRAETLQTLKLLSAPNSVINSLQNGLLTSSETHTESLARRANALALSGLPQASLQEQLLARQNSDSGYGGDLDYSSHALDTAFVLLAQKQSSSIELAKIAKTISYLKSVQAADGAFAINRQANVYTTAHSMLAAAAWANQTSTANITAPAVQWMLAQRNTSQHYGNTLDNALALWALSGQSSQLAILQALADALKAEQLANGSWNNDPYLTALALRALYISNDATPPAPTTAAISGVLVDAATGKALADVAVTVLNQNNPTSVASNANGGFNFSSLTPGSLTLRFAKVGYSSKDIPVSVTAGQSLNLGNIALSAMPLTASLNGVVKDQNGNVLPNVTIAVGTISALTNAQGQYQLAGINVGRATLTATLAGYQTVTVEIDLVAGTSYNFSPQMQGGNPPNTTSLNGVVVDANTNLPLAGATLTLAGSVQTSAADGGFNFATANAGSFVISVSANGYLPSSVTGVMVAGKNNLGTISLKPAPTTSSISGVVLDVTSRQAIAGAVVTVQGQSASVTTGADGKYNLNALTGTQFTLNFSAKNYISQQQTINLTQIGSAVVDVKLQVQSATNSDISFLKVATAETSYPASSTIGLEMHVANSANSNISALVSAQVLDAQNSVVYEYLASPYNTGNGLLGNSPVTIAANTTLELHLDWSAVRLAAGDYHIHAFAKDASGRVLAEGDAVFSVSQTLAIAGGVTADPPLAQVGSSTPINFSADLTNAGNATLPAGQAQLKVYLEAADANQNTQPETRMTGILAGGLPMTNPNRVIGDAQGNLYVLNGGATGKIIKVTPSGTQSEFATIPAPYSADLAFDSQGNILVGSNYPARLIKLTPSGQISTSALPMFTEIMAVATANNGNVFISGRFNVLNKNGATDFIEYRLVQHDVNGVDTILWKNGLSKPVGLIKDSGGNFVVTNSDDGSIVKIAPNTGLISQFVRGLGQPKGIIQDSNGNYLVADAGANSIVKITPDGQFSTYATGLNKPFDLKFGPDGLLYVTNEGDNTVAKVAANGTVAPYAQGLGNASTAMKFDAQGTLWFTDGYNLRTKDTQGNFNVVANGASAQGMAIAGNGDVYLADYDHGRVTKFSKGVLSVFAGGLSWPKGVAVDGNGDIYVSEYGEGRLVRFDSQGNKLGLIESTLRAPAMMRSASNGDLYIKNNNFISVKRSTGLEIAVRNFNYDVWAVDSVFGGFIAVNSNSVVRVDTNGVVTTLKAALPFTPNGISVDKAGNVLLSDASNKKVQKLDSNGVLTEFAVVPGVINKNEIFADSTGGVVLRQNNGAFIKVSPQGVANTVMHTVKDGFDLWNLDKNDNIIAVANSVTYRIDSNTGSSAVLLPNRGYYKDAYASAVGVDDSGNVVIADTYGGSYISMYATNGAEMGQIFGFNSAQDIIWTGSELRFVDVDGRLFSFNGNGIPVKLPGTLPSVKLAQIGATTFGKTYQGEVLKWTGASGKGYEVYTNFGTNIVNLAGKADGTLALSIDAENSLKIVDANKNVTQSFTNLNVPQGLAFDSAGRLYVANYMGHTIVRFDSLSNSSSRLFAHVGTAQNLIFDGAGNLYSTASPGFVRIDPNGVVSELEKSSRLKSIYLDGTTVYGVDTDNGQLMKYSPVANGYSASVISSGVAEPVAMATNANGDLFVVNRKNSTLSKYTPGKLETLTTIPAGMQTMTMGSDGVMTMAGNFARVGRVTQSGSFTDMPVGPMLDNRTINGIADIGGGKLELLSTETSAIYQLVTTKPPAPPAAGSLVYQTTAAMPAMDANGAYQHVDFGNWLPSFGGDYRFEVSRDGIAGSSTNFIHVGPNATGALSAAKSILPVGDSDLGMCLDLKGGDFTSMSRVEMGQVRAVSKSATTPKGMIGDRQGNLYVTDPTSLFKTNASGQSVLLASGMNLAFGLAIDSQQNFYVASKNATSSRFELLRIDLQGNKTVVADLGITSANGVQVNSKDEVLVASTGKLLKVDKAGNVKLVSTFGMSNPRGIAIDGKDNVYVQNEGDFVSMIKPDGSSVAIFTLANGTTHPKFEGDGYPNIAADCADNFFIAPVTWSRINQGQNMEEHTIAQVVPRTGNVAALFDTKKIHASLSDIDYLSFDRFNNRLLMWNDEDKSIWQAPVTCGAIGVKASLITSPGQTISGASKPPSATVTRADGRTEYVWSIADVTTQGSQVCFSASQAGLKLGEERKAIDSGFISFQNSFVANDVTVPLAIPKVKVGNLVNVVVVSDKPEYAANSTAQISTNLINSNGTPVIGDLNVQVFDSKNVLVTSVTQQNVSVPANGALPITAPLAIGTIIPAQYVIKASLSNSQGAVANAQSVFTVLPSNGDMSVKSSVVTDRKTYNASDKVVITSRVTSLSANVVLENLTLTVKVVDAAGSEQLNQSYPLLQLVPGASRDFSTTQVLRNLPQGMYTVKQTLADSQGHVFDQPSTTYTIGASADTGFGLVGSVTLSAKDVTLGENLALAYTVKNAGNSILSNLAVKLVVLDPATQTVITQLPLPTLNLAINQQATANAGWLASGNAGQVLAIALIANVAGKDITLASDNVSLKAPAVKVTGSVILSPKEVEVGNNLALMLQVNNAGVALKGISLQLNVLEEKTSALLYSMSKTVDVAAGATWNQGVDFKPTGVAGTKYLVNWSAQVAGKTYPLAQDSFVMIAPKAKLEITQQLGSWQNLLVLSSCKRAADDLVGQCGATAIPTENAATMAKCDADRVTATSNYLNGLGVSYKVTSSMAEFQNELRSGMYNTYWLSNGATAAREPAASELKAATLRGEGFMMDGISDGRNALLSQCAGIRYAGKYPVGSQTLNIANGMFSNGKQDSFEISTGAVKLTPDLSVKGAASQAKLATTDGIISAQSGEGKTLSFGFDLAETLRTQGQDQRWKAVTQKSLSYLQATAPSSNEVASAQVFNVATKVSNPGAAASVQVVQTLPPNTQIIATEPAAVLDFVFPDGAEEPTALTVTWTLNVAANSETKLNLRLRQYQTGQLLIDTKTNLVSAGKLSPYKQQDFVVTVKDAGEMLTKLRQDVAALPTTTAAQVAAKEAVVAALAKAQTNFSAGYAEVALRHLLAVQSRIGKIDSDGKQSAALARVIAAVEFWTLAS